MAVDMNKGIEFFARLYEGLEGDEPDLTAMRRSLDEQGVDVEATLSEGLRLFADHKKRERLRLAQRRLERLRGAVRTWAGGTAESLGTIKEEIARVLAGDGGEIAYQAYHRKLARVDAADVESLREDAALLEFIARIEADDAE